MIHDLSKTNSIFATFLAELRDVKIQKDSMRFRRNLERIAEIMAYEISKTMEYSEATVTTPLGEATAFLLKKTTRFSNDFKSWDSNASGTS